IKKVEINGYQFTPQDLSLFAQLLRSSKIGDLDLRRFRVDGNNISSIVEIASHAKRNLFPFESRSTLRSRCLFYSIGFTGAYFRSHPRVF
ncbi:hypothetical protein PMAYCL1PPCAC_26447, partial [Pristionchus mayeri]